MLSVSYLLFSQFKCCGVTNKTDWYDVLNGTLPSSCCSLEIGQCVDGWSEVSLLHRYNYFQKYWNHKVNSFNLYLLYTEGI